MMAVAEGVLEVTLGAERAAGLSRGGSGSCGVAAWLCCGAWCQRTVATDCIAHGQLDKPHNPCNDVMIFSDSFAYYDI